MLSTEQTGRNEYRYVFCARTLFEESIIMLRRRRRKKGKLCISTSNLFSSSSKIVCHYPVNKNEDTFEYNSTVR